MLNPVSSSESPNLEVDTPGNHSTSVHGDLHSLLLIAAQSSMYGCLYTLSLFNFSPICGHLRSFQYFTISNALKNNLEYMYFYIVEGGVSLG